MPTVMPLIRTLYKPQLPTLTIADVTAGETALNTKAGNRPSNEADSLAA